MSASFIPPIINSVMFQQQGLGLSTRSVEADLQTKLDVCPALPQEKGSRGALKMELQKQRGLSQGWLY